MGIPSLPDAQRAQLKQTFAFLHISLDRSIKRRVGNLPVLSTALSSASSALPLLHIDGQLSLLLFQINADPNILPNVTLVMRWSDTRGETVEATKAMIDMICDGVVAFFGPEGSCYVEAIVAQSRNIPMISYVSESQVFTAPARSMEERCSIPARARARSTPRLCAVELCFVNKRALSRQSRRPSINSACHDRRTVSGWRIAYERCALSLSRRTPRSTFLRLSKRN